jgi:enterochelin esterase-like enzyme
MLKRVGLIAAAVLIAAPTLAQSGRVFENLTVSSKILGEDRAYAVYLPPDYDSSDRAYPVMYLLHGAGDDHTGWVQYGEVAHIADAAINDGSSTAMVIVMPDGQTTARGWFNKPAGNWRFEDFFFEELVPHVESQFRIRSQKQYRAVSGLSMGGGGSFMYAMHRPDMFAAAAPLSAQVGGDIWERIPYAGDVSGLSREALEAYRLRHNAIDLAQTLPVEQLQSVRWFIDCGDEDSFSANNARVHIALSERRVPHEYRVRDGGHSWSYWRGALPHVLAFVSESFRR